MSKEFMVKDLIKKLEKLDENLVVYYRVNKHLIKCDGKVTPLKNLIVVIND